MESLEENQYSGCQRGEFGSRVAESSVPFGYETSGEDNQLGGR